MANVNTDMFLPLFPLKILMVLGLDESDLGRDIRATAKELSLEIQADPEPQRNRFVRSDQYSFIKVGVPALAMKVGYLENTPEAAIAAKWTAERYHAPSDDLSQPVDLSAADKFVDVLKNVALRIANRPDRPKWSGRAFLSVLLRPFEGRNHEMRKTHNEFCLCALCASCGSFYLPLLKTNSNGIPAASPDILI